MKYGTSRGRDLPELVDEAQNLDYLWPIPYGSKYPNMRYLPKTTTTIPNNIETLNGYVCWYLGHLGRRVRQHVGLLRFQALLVCSKEDRSKIGSHPLYLLSRSDDMLPRSFQNCFLVALRRLPSIWPVELGTCRRFALLAPRLGTSVKKSRGLLCESNSPSGLLQPSC